MFPGHVEFEASLVQTRHMHSSPEIATVDPSYTIPNFSTSFKNAVGRNGFNIPALVSMLL